MKRKLPLDLVLKLCILGILIQLLHPSSAFAGGTVTVCDEGNLRAALVGGGLVTMACDGTITLANTLVITNDTTIDATGHSINLNGGNTVRLFLVNTGVTASFFNLTLANGRHVGADGIVTPLTDGQPGQGGAILNWGTVQLTGCSVISNSVTGGAGALTGDNGSSGGSGLGGAIFNGGGNVFATNTSFIANGSVGGADGTQGFSGPFPSAGHGKGGAIFNSGGTLILEATIFSMNTAIGGPIVGNSGAAGDGLGGAVWSDGPSVELHQCAFSGNFTRGLDVPSIFASGFSIVGSAKGGAVCLQSGVIHCIDCTFITNSVTAGHKPRFGTTGLSEGGALWNHGSLSVARCNFFGDQAVGNGVGSASFLAGDGKGGAIFSDTLLALSESSFVTNTCWGAGSGSFSGRNYLGGAGYGGAICNLGILNTTNCTLVLNTAFGGPSGLGAPNPPQLPGGTGAGGGLFNSGTAILVNLTLSSNRAVGGSGGGFNPGTAGPPGPALGGGIYNTNGAVATLANTLIAFSTSGSNCLGVLVDLGHNLSSDSSAGFSAPGSLNNTDPVLGPLDFYGGPTPTMPLLAGSPAIDGGDTALGPPIDQRGRTRPYGAASDIGAFESSAPFVIRGNVSGWTLSGEVNVVCESTNANTINGNYSLEGLAAGTFTVTPSDPNYNFFPTNQLITVGPDQLGIDFKAYRWNALSLEGVSGGTLRMLFAGTNGLSYRVLFSTNLSDWIPVSTNIPVSSNLFEILDTSVQSRPAGFYRTVQP